MAGKTSWEQVLVDQYVDLFEDICKIDVWFAIFVLFSSISYQDDERLIMKGHAQCSPVYG